MISTLFTVLYDLSLMLYSDKTSVNEILPNLWLGNYYAALDTKFLLENNIDYVINCTSTIPFIHNVLSEKQEELGDLHKLYNIDTFRIPVEDSLLQKDIILMEEYFKVIIPLLLRKYIVEHKKILIHCYAGKQRSAIVVAALLKVLLDNKYIDLTEVPKDLTPNDQFNYICNYILLKRPQVFTYGFRINFEQSYKRHFGIDF